MKPRRLKAVQPSPQLVRFRICGPLRKNIGSAAVNGFIQAGLLKLTGRDLPVFSRMFFVYLKEHHIKLNATTQRMLDVYATNEWYQTLWTELHSLEHCLLWVSKLGVPYRMQHSTISQSLTKNLTREIIILDTAEYTEEESDGKAG